MRMSARTHSSRTPASDTPWFLTIRGDRHADWAAPLYRRGLGGSDRGRKEAGRYTLTDRI